jgi:type IV pilus assembly protein PilB
MRNVGRPRIGELLVEAKVITQGQLDEALGQPRAEGVRLGQHLVAMGLVNDTQLTQTLSLQLSIPWVSLYHIDFSRQLLNMVPREIAEKFCAVPIFLRAEKKKPTTLYVAMDDPTNEQALAAIAAAASVPVKPMIASQKDIRAAIRVYYAGGGEEAAGPMTTRDRPHKAAPAKPPPLPPPLPPSAGPRLPMETVVDNMELRVAEAALADVMPPRSVQRPPAPATGDSPDADPELEVSEYVVTARPSNGPRMVELTLLDGTTLNLPARTSVPPRRAGGGSIPPSAGGISDQLTAHDLVAALTAVAHGADASEVLGETDWQAMFAALLSIMLKKNLIADWEFIEELRSI